MNKNILTTLIKELRSIFRDKRTLFTLFLYPILIPAMVFLYGSIYESTSNEEDSSYTIGINYELSDTEKALMDSFNLEVKNYDDNTDIKKLLDSDNISAFITYKDNTYTIYADSSSTSGLVAHDMVYSYFDAYNEVLTRSYLTEKGINLEEAYNHFKIEEEEVTGSNYMIVVLLGVSFTYIILAICISSGNLAVQSTALEKENGTLETILTFPITKTELIVGKYLSSVVVGFVAGIVSLVFMVVAMLVGKNMYTMFDGYEFLINFKTIFGSLLTILAAAIFISGLSFLLTSSAKSFKEAQGKIGLLNMLGIIPMFVSILEVPITKTYYLIPICNFERILNDLFMNHFDISSVLISLGSTIVYTVIVIYFVVKSYNSEDILFKN